MEPVCVRSSDTEKNGNFNSDGKKISSIDMKYGFKCLWNWNQFVVFLAEKSKKQFAQWKYLRCMK